MIWGLTLEPGKMYTRVMGDEIQLSMASLESRTDYGDESDGYSHVVMKTTKSEYLLCTLVHGLTFQQNLDLKLRPKETVTFSVQGCNVVYLMGYSATDSEVEDQIDIEELEEESVNEVVEFEEGVIVEEETLQDHSEQNVGDDNSIAMATVEMNRHTDQLESRVINPLSMSSDVPIEVNRPGEFSSGDSSSVHVNVKVEETLQRLKEEPEDDDDDDDTIIVGEEEQDSVVHTDVVPTGIQRSQVIKGRATFPHSSWGNSNFETYTTDLQPVHPTMPSVSSLPTGDGRSSSKSLTVAARKHKTSRKTNPSTAQRMRDRPIGNNVLTQLLTACYPSKNQTRNQGIAVQDTSKSYPVFCPLCRIPIRGIKQFEVHLRSHTGEKPFMCSICGKSFSQVQNKDRHERTHTGVRPFPCRFCNRTFTQNHHLKRHEEKLHGGTSHY